MITYNFDRIFKARGVVKPFTYLTKSGFSSQFATKVSNNKVRRIGLLELEKLCLLLRCTPNDFYEWVPENDQKVGKDHPIYTIRKSDTVIDITRALNAVPLNKLDKLEELINQVMKPEESEE